MKISWFESVEGDEKDLFDSEGVPPSVGAFVYVNDKRNVRGIGKSIKYEVIRVDHSISLHSKPLFNLSPEVKRSIINDTPELHDELFRGRVFKLNLVENVVEYSNAHVQVIIKRVEKKPVEQIHTNEYERGYEDGVYDKMNDTNPKNVGGGSDYGIGYRDGFRNGAKG